MLWRAPWLRHRLGLMAAAGWDGITIYTIYNLTYLERIGQREGLSLGLIIMASTWLALSYVIGRYSTCSGDNSRYWADLIGKCLIVGTAIIGIFVGHAWIFQVANEQTRLRGFLIPVVAITCLASGAGKAVIDSFAARKREWILVVNSVERETLLKECMTFSKGLRHRTQIWNAKETNEESFQSGGKHRGIAVGGIEGKDGSDIERILLLRERGERVIPLINWCENEIQRIPPELIQANWLIQAEGFGLRPGSISWRVKRFGDVIGGFAILSTALPLLLVAGCLIWIEDRGPVFYRQTRSGLYGRKITIWKLRSMKVNAEKAGAQWASKNDPRVTRVGRFIRATRIDELPQLLSVLNGDLSLIGPRPERPEIEEELERKIPNYRIRHWVRPGLSGWAQVCYPYGASIEDSRAKLSYDLYYLRNAGILLDALVFIKTVKLVFRAEGSHPSR